MAGTFAARIRELMDRVGDGIMVGEVVVNQVYAAPIERGFWVSGPLAGHTNQPRHGGQHHYLRDPLFAGAPLYWQQVADRVFEPDGIYLAMVDNVEVISAQVAVLAPVEFGDLRRSASPRVYDNGHEVYYRAPGVERLSEAQIDAKNDLLERAHDSRGRLTGRPWADHDR